MNERFIRCSECGLPHEERLRTCPATGREIVRRPPVPTGRPPAAAPSVPGPPLRPTVTTQTPPRAGRDSVDFELVGTLVGGRYRVREILGQGGMGTVYEALREELGNVVAIKVLHPNQLHKKDAVQRFHHEARAAARIGHPNICEVYDVGTLDDGRPYLVMDRLIGVTLAERIQTTGGLPFQEVVDTLTQVLSGLHAAHQKGIIHRDIKPENVFLTQRVGCAPVAKILDFGVSKVLASSPGAVGFSDVEVTRTGVVLGTPYYLAPEQAKGERTLDPRVDLYTCGVMLYEALTGRRPFRAANYNALLIAILTSTPRPAREIRPDMPAGFSRIIQKAMAREPADRYQTALEFQAALEPYSHGSSAPRDMPASLPAPPRVPAVADPLPAGRGRGFSDEDLGAFVESASDEMPPPPAAPAPPPRVSTVAPGPRVPRPTPSSPPAAPLARPLTSPPFARPPTQPGPIRPSSGPPLARPPTQPGPVRHETPPFARPLTQPGPIRPSSFPLARPPTQPGALRPDAAPLARPAAGPPPSAPTAPAPTVRTQPVRQPNQNFDDEGTDIDLPRAFHTDEHTAASSSTTRPAREPSRRPAPLLGPPLQPPPEDEGATEIMSGSIRSHLSEPAPRKKESVRPPRPASTRPPRR